MAKMWKILRVFTVIAVSIPAFAQVGPPYNPGLSFLPKAIIFGERLCSPHDLNTKPNVRIVTMRFADIGLGLNWCNNHEDDYNEGQILTYEDAEAGNLVKGNPAEGENEDTKQDCLTLQFLWQPNPLKAARYIGNINDNSVADWICDNATVVGCTAAHTCDYHYNNLDYDGAPNGASGDTTPWQNGNDGDIRKELKIVCKRHYREVKKQLSNECQYIGAYQTSIDLEASGSGCGNIRSQIQAVFFPDFGTNGDCTYDHTWTNAAPPYTTHFEKGCTKTSRLGQKTPIFGVKFQVEDDPACQYHIRDGTKNSCATCFEDRANWNDSSHTNDANDPMRDPVFNVTNTAAALAAGGFIKHQGCAPQASSRVLGTIGGNDGDYNLSDVISGITTEPLSILVPECVLVPGETGADYDRFENHDVADSPQKRYAYDVIDKTYQDSQFPPDLAALNNTQSEDRYDDRGTPQRSRWLKYDTRNPYKGNCGRGKFFYRDLEAKDSNLFSLVDPASPGYDGGRAQRFRSLRITDNDIWESRTGCYNPEERFVHLPAGVVTEEIEYYTPNRATFTFEGMNAATKLQLLSDQDYVDKYLDNMIRTLNVLDDMSDPWDEPKRQYAGLGDIASNPLQVLESAALGRQGTDLNEDGIADPVNIDVMQPVRYLVPNDRILMRHPMCQTDYTDGLDPLNPDWGEMLKKWTASFSNKLNSLKLYADDSRIAQGALPMCLGNDILDDRDAFCSHYLDRQNQATDLGINSGITLPVNTSKNYYQTRYVFDYGSFCWKPDKKPYMLNPSQDDKYMPVALKGPEPTTEDGDPLITQSSDVFGNDIYFRNTDHKRSLQTHYAGRMLAQSGTGEQDDPYTFRNLEEYGYRDVALGRSNGDLNLNPNNIYRPDSEDTFSASARDLPENIGRKQKLQQCLRLFIEQWAFEGDRGAIVLDTNYKVQSELTGARRTADASMCQWVAYYDTSANYGTEKFEFLDPSNADNQRNLYKAAMLFYFAKVQEVNQKYREDNNTDDNVYNSWEIPGEFSLGYTSLGDQPVFSVSTSWNSIIPSDFNPTDYLYPSMSGPTADPQRLRPDSRNNNAQSAFGNPLNNMNDDGFRRRRGMRPEIFDYYNFLANSALAVMEEGLDVTNATRVGDGNIFGRELEQYSGATDLVAAIGVSPEAMETSLYTPTLKIPTDSGGSIDLTSLSGSGGWQINMERRNCNSVVPPHFWGDVIKPFSNGKCDMDRGALMVNSIGHSLRQNEALTVIDDFMETMGDALGVDMDGGFSGLLETILGNILDPSYKHWMTTNINQPITSLITPVPMLPVFAFGFNQDKKVYIKANLELFEIPQFGQDPWPLSIEDAWLSRAGGEATIGFNVVEERWKGNWAGNEQYFQTHDPANDGWTVPTLEEDQTVPVADKTQQRIYNHFNDTYTEWKERPKNITPDIKHGMIVMDERSKSSGREWVEHTWPAQSCMHSLRNIDNMLDITGMPYGINIPLIAGEGSAISMVDRIMNPNFIPPTPGFIPDLDQTLFNYDPANPPPEIANLPYLWSKHGQRYYETTDPGLQKQFKDAWSVEDDINMGRIPILKVDTSDPNGANPIMGVGAKKEFGGFVYDDTQPRIFKWLPHPWSISVGLSQAFWCEFEVPYNPFFVGKDEGQFHRTPNKSHWAINAQKGMAVGLEANPVPEDAKPKLEYYRVERIRDACGPYGMRSTWLEDPNNELALWLLGEDDLNSSRVQSRCSGWLDMYRKGVRDPKVVAWRLPRFDYEFLKSFLECTGPVVEPRNPCAINQEMLDLNNNEALCEIGKALANVALRTYAGDKMAIECMGAKVQAIASGDGISITVDVDLPEGSPISSDELNGMITDKVQGALGDTANGVDLGCMARGCKYKDGTAAKPSEQILNNVIRALDFATRGDTFYGYDHQVDPDDVPDPEDEAGGGDGGDGTPIPGGNPPGGGGPNGSGNSGEDDIKAYIGSDDHEEEIQQAASNWSACMSGADIMLRMKACIKWLKPKAAKTYKYLTLGKPVINGVSKSVNMANTVVSMSTGWDAQIVDRAAENTLKNQAIAICKEVKSYPTPNPVAQCDWTDEDYKWEVGVDWPLDGNHQPVRYSFESSDGQQILNLDYADCIIDTMDDVKTAQDMKRKLTEIAHFMTHSPLEQLLPVLTPVVGIVNMAVIVVNFIAGEDVKEWVTKLALEFNKIHAYAQIADVVMEVLAKFITGGTYTNPELNINRNFGNGMMGAVDGMTAIQAACPQMLSSACLNAPAPGPCDENAHWAAQECQCVTPNEFNTFRNVMTDNQVVNKVRDMVGDEGVDCEADPGATACELEFLFGHHQDNIETLNKVNNTYNDVHEGLEKFLEALFKVEGLLETAESILGVVGGGHIGGNNSSSGGGAEGENGGPSVGVSIGGPNKNIGDPKYQLEGFRDWKAHSVQRDKFWLREDGNNMDKPDYADNEPFGFWCSCGEDDPRTTRCREDFCTTEQHVLIVGRNFGADDGIMDKIRNVPGIGTIIDSVMAPVEKLTKPIAISKKPGPFNRWLQCYYQARAKSCPILTRDISDTPAYSTLVDPFPLDREQQAALPEFSGQGQNFNVCDADSPTGIGDKTLDQFLRWSREEPNHLARLPVSFESAGGGYKHEDMVFYTQVRDYEPPYMELAVPFPIDLVTRDCQTVMGADGTYHCANTDRPKCPDILSVPQAWDPVTGSCRAEYSPNTQDFTNSLGEINQREGTTDIDYLNPSNQVDEFAAAETYKKGFRSPLLRKSDASKIEPTSDRDWSHFTPGPAGEERLHDFTRHNYSSLYMKYIKGLYAAAKGFKHDKKAVAPQAPDSQITVERGSAAFWEDAKKDYGINPRSQDAIVGPRGCDIGGWHEMMLYQARCIRWFKLNCICDYDKTFASGNAMSFALNRAGMEFNVAEPSLGDNIDKFQTRIAKDARGDVIYALQPGQDREVTGQVTPQTGRSEKRSGFFGGMFNWVFGSPEDARNTPAMQVVRDIYGTPVLKGHKNIEVRTGAVPFPLANKGHISPEFAYSSGTAHRFKGLSNVMVGDIIYWDESISAKVNGKQLDAGYPRHMAYVTAVDRGDDGSENHIPRYISIEEMNWGKNLDSCGNTDMWGKKTSRVIHNPNIKYNVSVNSIVETNLTGQPSTVILPMRAGSPVDKYASCQNADWAMCVERFWDQVSVYRPYTISLAQSVQEDSNQMNITYNVQQDPAYTQAICSAVSAAFPKVLSESRQKVIALEAGVPQSVIDKGMPSVRQYVRQKIEEGADGYDLNEVMYRGDKWKVFVENHSLYAADEVEAFLSNPLFGALDRCDPPAELRSNYSSVITDAMRKSGVRHNRPAQPQPDGPVAQTPPDDGG